MTLKSIFAILILTPATGCFAQKTLHYADSIRKSSGIPELCYAVVTDDKILEIAALGTHAINVSDTATLMDRFHIGSNTKAMTAFVIAKYVETGALNWDDYFFDLFPEWKAQSRPEYFNITLQDLLCHRARIQPFQGEDDPPIPPFSGTKQEQRTAFGKLVLTLPPVIFDTLLSYSYSNAGYTLAALMLEKVTQKSWEDLVEKVFNQDLHLNIRFSWPDNQTQQDTWGHSFENNQLIPVPSTTAYHLDYTEPAGDINITLTDYIKFIQLNLLGLEGHDNYLKAATYHFIHYGMDDYSFGWFNIHENGREFSTHSGTAGTYYTISTIDKNKYIGYIIFTNAFSEATVNGTRLLLRKLKQEYGS